MHQGSPGGWVLLCLSGRLKVVYSEPDGREILLAVRGPGDVVGEFSGRDGKPRSGTVQAIESGTTARLSDRRFRDVIGRFGVSDQLQIYIMGKVRESTTHAWELAHRATAARLADLIETIIDAAGAGHPDPHTIAMSQEELASALGLARSAVTPVIARWKATRIIRITRGKLHVLDRLALSSYGQNDQ